MGLSKSKQKTTSNQTATVAPNAVYSPYIDDAAGAVKSAYGSAQANLPSLMSGVNSANDYFKTQLSGANLNGNPYIDGIIKTTNDGITNDVNSQFSSAGRYGSGMHAGILATKLADADNALRYQNYSTERGYQNAAAGGLLQGTGIAAALPQAASGTYADQIRALLGSYTTGQQNGTQTTTSSPSIMQTLLQLSSNAAKAGAGGG